MTSQTTKERKMTGTSSKYFGPEGLVVVGGKSPINAIKTLQEQSILSLEDKISRNSPYFKRKYNLNLVTRFEERDLPIELRNRQYIYHLDDSTIMFQFPTSYEDNPIVTRVDLFCPKGVTKLQRTKDFYSMLVQEGIL